MAKLYSDNQDSTRGSLRLKYKKGSLLSHLSPYQLNKKLPKLERIDIYNCSSKMNNLFLSLLTSENKDLNA
jgi:hypothetical protein